MYTKNVSSNTYYFHYTPYIDEGKKMNVNYYTYYLNSIRSFNQNNKGLVREN